MVETSEEDSDESDIEDLIETRLSLEKDLERFLLKDVESVEIGMKLMENNYHQVSVESGIIDILAIDSNEVITVIELKAGEAKDRVLA